MYLRLLLRSPISLLVPKSRINEHRLHYVQNIDTCVYNKLLISGAAYIVSQNLSSWREVECDLATPELSFSENGIFVNNSTEFLNLRERIFWIGYVLKSLNNSNAGKYTVIYHKTLKHFVRLKSLRCVHA